MDIWVCKQLIKIKSIKDGENYDQVPIKTLFLWYMSQQPIRKAFVLLYNLYFVAHTASSNKERKRELDRKKGRISNEGIPDRISQQNEAFPSKMVSNVDSPDFAYHNLTENKHNNDETTCNHVDIGSQSIIEKIIMTNVNTNTSAADEYNVGKNPHSQR
ncbi:hypothetical protein LIER_36146 [Lithospermum erythrorhizon]|uniref:Uncharacterized protein n=1 Tax=Lithospermum erythrorhizon TaxID=34254 RepID=A0AAV3P1L5_LITER